MSFYDNPSYQRMIQRLGRIRPEQAAVVDTLAIDQKFADEETRKALEAMALENDKKYRDRSLALREKALDTRTGLAEDVLGERSKQQNLSTILGIGNVAASVYYGGKRDEIEQELLRKIMATLK